MAPLPAWQAAAGRPLRGRLAVRIATGLCIAAALILLGAGAWNLRSERAHLTRLVSLSADRIAEIVRGATRDAMLRNDREGLHRTIQDIAAQQGINRIRIFNKEGTIKTSTDPAEVGTLVNKGAEQCYACHQRDRPLDRLERADRVRIFRGNGGERVLGIIAPIHNEPQCTTACHAHPASQTVLGVLDVQLSLTSVDQAIASSEWQMLGGLAATVVAVLLVAGLLVWQLVLRPVGRLTRAMARVAAGDLETRLRVTSHDEIADMTTSWNAMTDDLLRARQQLEDWNRTLEQRVAEKTTALETAHQQMLLVEKMASLGKLAAVVAHEINNPLAGIRTYARLLRRRFAPPAGSPATGDGETDRILQVIDSEAGRCGDIVRNLLLFSRAKEARFAPEDLVPLLERCRMLLRHQAEMLGVELVLEAEPGLPRLECDGSQMEQMMLALALNALEATPAGGRVSVSAQRNDQGIRIVVADTGHGIPPASQARIFEPFFTTKEQGKGVGLGLAVVYGIVVRHHGRIDVESQLGQGTRFTIHLPWTQPVEAAQPAEKG